MTHVIFPDEGEGPSMKEMSLDNRAGMQLQLQLQRTATCALMQEVCEQRGLYMLHDLMLVNRLWMAPPLSIVSAVPHVTYHTCGRPASESACTPLLAPVTKKCKGRGNGGKKNREGGVRVS